jgi:hypothetical protein
MIFAFIGRPPTLTLRVISRTLIGRHAAGKKYLEFVKRFNHDLGTYRSAIS